MRTEFPIDKNRNIFYNKVTPLTGFLRLIIQNGLFHFQKRRTGGMTGEQKSISDMIVGMLFRRDDEGLRQAEIHYGAGMLSLAGNITGSRETAEEIVNDALLKVWNSIPPEYPLSLHAYVMRIVRNLAISRVRSESAKKRPDVVCELDEVLPAPGAPEDDPAEEYSLGKAVNAFLSSIDKRSRRVFVLRYFNEEEISGIAKRMKMTEDAVKSVLKRTRKKLKKHLEKEGWQL